MTCGLCPLRSGGHEQNFDHHTRRIHHEKTHRKSASYSGAVLYAVALGGICGRIIAVKDETDSVIIETGSDRARLRIKRWAIGSVDTIHEEDA